MVRGNTPNTVYLPLGSQPLSHTRNGKVRTNGCFTGCARSLPFSCCTTAELLPSFIIKKFDGDANKHSFHLCSSTSHLWFLKAETGDTDVTCRYCTPDTRPAFTYDPGYSFGRRCRVRDWPILARAPRWFTGSDQPCHGRLAWKCPPVPLVELRARPYSIPINWGSKGYLDRFSYPVSVMRT